MADAPKITPITIKPIAIKPMAAKPAPAAAPKPAAPAPAAAGPAIRPIVIAPGAAAGKPLAADGNTATIRLSPSPKPAAPAPMPAPAASAPAPAAPKPIALKPAVVAPAAAPAASAPAAADSTPTVVIKPIAVKPKIVAAPAAAPAAPATPQSAKSTTSRISLDSALSQPPAGGAKPAAMGKITSNLTQAAVDAAKSRTAKVSLALPDADDASRQQTIRVKAPVPGGAPAAAPAPAPADEAAAPAPADASEAPTVRKKSLVLKKPVGPAGGTPSKPTLKLKADPAPKPADAGEKKEGIAEGSGPGGGLDDIETPPSAMSQGGALQAGPVRKQKTHWVFPLVAFFDIAAAIAVIVVFAAQAWGRDRSLTDFTSFGKDGEPFTIAGSVLAPQ